MGAHKFYLRYDNGGAIYFLVTVLGLVLTLYMPIWVTIFDFDINLAIVILLLPLVVSIIEFFILRDRVWGSCIKDIAPRRRA